MTKDEWRIVRVAIQWLLDERINLPINDETKITSIDDLREEMVGWQFEVMISGTLELTEKALHDAIENMAEAHRLASKIKVSDPSDEEITTIKKDLQAVSRSLAADAKLSAAGKLLSSIAQLLPGDPSTGAPPPR